MSAISDRYDRAAARYQKWWAPVLEETAVRVLDRLAGKLPLDEPQRIVDIGTGTGTLVLEAVRRWPRSLVTGADASSGMIVGARERARTELAQADQERLSLVVAEADRLPFADASFDAAVSSFVFQLVPDRAAAFREVRRVLRPGGLLVFVTWMLSDIRFAADEAFFDVVDELRIPDQDGPEEDRTGDLVSPRSAADQLRRVGYRDVSAAQEWLEYRFDRVAYVDFLEEYGESDLFRSLEPRMRRRLRQRATERLESLPATDFDWRVPVVMAVARRG